MRHTCKILLVLVVLMVAASAAQAWQPILIADGVADAKAKFYSEAVIASGNASGAKDVQVTNSGTGVMTVSFFRFVSSDTTWSPALPYAAAAVGQTFYGIADSVYTLAAGQSVLIENIPSRKQPHALFITRTPSTSVKVLWK